MHNFKKFSVEYAMKPNGSIQYIVEAQNSVDARRVADRWYAIECAGYAIKKVKVKEIV